MTSPSVPRTQSPEPTRLRWWFEDSSGELVLAQPPNVAASASTALLTGSRLPFLPVQVRLVLKVLGRGTLCWWAIGEVARGRTPARRVIGAVVGVRQVARVRKRRA